MGILTSKQLCIAIIDNRLRNYPQTYLTRLGYEEDLKNPFSKETIKLLREFQIENLLFRNKQNLEYTYIHYVIPLWRKTVLL